MEADSRIKYLTNLSINSQGAVLYEIQKQERVHWFLGLRQAELIIQDKQAALEHNYYEQRKQEREIKRSRIKIESLSPDNPLDQLEIEELEDKIAIARSAIDNLSPLLRDAVMEHQTAVGERTRILRENSIAHSLTYEELQASITPECLNEKLSRYTASRIWASQNHLSEGVGELLFDLSPRDREIVMTREMEIRSGVTVSETIIHAAKILSHHPPEIQQQALLQAAHLLMES